MGLIYRVQQFFRILNARPDPAQRARVLEILGPALTELFYRMTPSDQAHGLRVLHALELEGHNDPDLLAAALLHDVGKSVHSPSVLDRIVVVLANQIIPRRVLRWGVSDVRGWRRPFAIAAQHARWGAELTVEHGASSTLVDLIRNHQDPASEDTRLLLKHLQRVDSQN